MQINKNAHLCYCSNIHAGESWQDTFENLKKFTSPIKKKITNQRFGIGLRLSNIASKELCQETNLNKLITWLEKENIYIFTLNGFPYGNFHNTSVKDNVHQPDWETNERLAYTKRLFIILEKLIPKGMDGGVSTSPISYRYWEKVISNEHQIKINATHQLIDLICLIKPLSDKSGVTLHLDIEPEPDGLIENSSEFIHFFKDYLLKIGKPIIQKIFNMSENDAEKTIKNHIRCCFDICHFSVIFEDINHALNNFINEGIKIGKVQISSALKFNKFENEMMNIKELQQFDEPTYLHQTAIKTKNGRIHRFKDLNEALHELSNLNASELRSHYHIPIFKNKFSNLNSTQDDILKTLAYWNKNNITNHLEIETYTWEVLPKEYQEDQKNNIIRELLWVKETLDEENSRS